MKKFFYTLILCILAMGAWAQETAECSPFVEKGKVWHLEIFNVDGGREATNYTFSAKEVTKRNGKTYLLLQQEWEGQVSDVALIREESGRVYIYDPKAEGGSDERLLYDFTLKKGDTFMYEYEGGKFRWCEVKKVGDVVFNGQKLKKLTFEYILTYGDELGGVTVTKEWVEGIGSFEGPLFQLEEVLPDAMTTHVAYVYGDKTGYWAFPFNELLCGCRGLPLIVGKDLSDEIPLAQWGHDDLHYEFVAGTPAGDNKDFLHVYGAMWLTCSPYQYFYCVGDGEGNCDLTFRPAELWENDCKGFYEVDIYFPYFNATSGVQYTVTDREGTHEVRLRQEPEYRPFIEDGKVWTVKWEDKLHPEAYYYIDYFFTKDVVVNGKQCKKMAYKCDYRPLEGSGWGHIPETDGDAGTYYEEDKRVYYTWSGGTPLLMYDFGAGIGDTIQVYSPKDRKAAPFVIDGKRLEESESFKGISTRLRSVLRPDGETDTWMEGVGWMTRPVDDGNNGGNCYLMACTVGDEVLYKHPDWTIDESEALGKKRVDFTHVIKTKPKSPKQRTEKVGNGMISGEYSMNVLAIDLGTLHDAYTVTIKASSGNVVYTKEVKTSRVLALNIDIAEYTDGDYTITVENNREIFTGLFNISRLNAIEEVPSTHPVADNALHDLTGRPVAGHPQRGVYIRNGKKCWVK